MNSRENVPPAQIESELKKLWARQDVAGATRACLFNLVIYTQDPARSAYFRETIKMVIEKFPCRIIMIQVEPQATESYLRTGVATETAGEGQDTITCEQINIDASGDFLTQIPFLLLPHLLPDLPVYLIWGQDPCNDSEILPHLSQFAKRVIFDSDSSEDLHSFADTTLGHLGCGTYDLLDINWARLSGWRRVMAQVFDCVDRIESLRQAAEITITYNSASHDMCRHNSLQARYFQAWLAGQMGWKFVEASKSSEGIRICYETLIVTLKARECDKLFPGSLQSVTVNGSNGTSFSLERVMGQRLVQVHASSKETCELPLSVPLSTQERGMQFLTEIFYESPSSQYKTMLGAMAQQTKVCP